MEEKLENNDVFLTGENVNHLPPISAKVIKKKRPQTAPVQSKIGSLTYHNKLKSAQEMAKITGHIDPENPDYIKDKIYLEWLSQKQRTARAKKKVEKLSEKEKSDKEKEEMEVKKAENKLAI